jgi:hypothetical protein
VPPTNWSACIDTLCAHVTEHYVFPDVAERIVTALRQWLVAALRQRLADGAYDGIECDEAFAAAVTATCSPSTATNTYG